jgi:hypothetical protein
MNLLLGWWGIISMFVTPGYFLHNIAQYEHAVRLIFRTRKQRAKSLEDALKVTQREIK